VHVHILGICGTFMAGVAVLARALGHKVTGSDAGVYPPMSEVLDGAGIAIREGYDPSHLLPAPDLVVIGNALSRGNPALEQVLASGLPYTSGPAWMADHVLSGRWVIAVSGTHGKTTTTSLIAYLLTRAGLEPGFLVGGMVPDLGASAALGRSPFFVIEADEYDTAFFDKRSKFVHYRPRTLVMNNLEFDHADIFPDLAAIETQFHHLVRTVPRNGRILRNVHSEALDRVLAKGVWTPVRTFGTDEAADTAVGAADDAWQCFEVRDGGDRVTIDSPLIGRFNAENVAAALAAVAHAGVPMPRAADALRGFRGVRRRLEVVYESGDVTIYDDFAHHPTAIAATLAAVRARIGRARLVAVVEPRSNTMRMGVHRDALPGALAEADDAHVFVPPALTWTPKTDDGANVTLHHDLDALVSALAKAIRPGDHIVIMSNGSFGGLPGRLTRALVS